MPPKDVFILGAGFSKAISSQMPTMKELTKKVKERIQQDGWSLPLPLLDDEQRGRALEENIELWMTYLSQSQPWLNESFVQDNQALATRIRFYIKEVIEATEKETSMRPSSVPDWLSTLIKQWSIQEASVITLNYDTLVERAALTLSDSDINGGEGLSPGQIYPPYVTNVMSRAGAPVFDDKIHAFAYYKLHGSVNWHYSGRQDYYGETIFYSGVSPWGSKSSDLEKASRSFSRDMQSLIIPPVAEKTTFFNNETVRWLWRDAGNELDGAKRVFVIGYSLPVSDLGMRFFLKHNLPVMNTKWYIVDTCPSVVSLYKKLLAPQQTISKDFIGIDAVRNLAEAYPCLP